MSAAATICREVLDAHDARLTATRGIYETTLSDEERIPWEWIERSLSAPRGEISAGAPRWRPHLVIGGNADDGVEIDTPLGFVYGSYYPGWAGYVCYLCVDPLGRGRGLATKLFEGICGILEDDARRGGSELPFLIWESHPPAENATLGERATWNQRLKLFNRVGGHWLRNVRVHTPNYLQRDAADVGLELFIRPLAKKIADFDEPALRQTVLELYSNVYKMQPTDVQVVTTLTSAAIFELVNPLEGLLNLDTLEQPEAKPCRRPKSVVLSGTGSPPT